MENMDLSMKVEKRLFLQNMMKLVILGDEELQLKKMKNDDL